MIVKIFKDDYLKRLDNIIQWSEKDVFNKESVSQHSYKVTIFCRVLLEEVFGKNKTRKQREFIMSCVDHAMFHDWDEALLLRDISHETKYNPYNGEEIRNSLNNLSKYLGERELTDETPCGSFIFDSLNEVDEDVLTLCKFCDWLALAFFIQRELLVGNQNLSKQIETVHRGLLASAEKCETMFYKRFNLKVNIINKFFNVEENE